MSNEQMLAKLLEVKEFGNVSPLASGTLDALIMTVKQDIASAEARKSLGQNKYKAALAFAKYCAKQNLRPTLAGAFPLSGGRQGICDGYRGVVYEQPYDGLPEIEKHFYPDVIDMDKILPNEDAKLIEVEMPSLAELKTNFKIAKAAYTGKAGYFNHTTKIVATDGSHRWFNTKYLIEMIECVEPSMVYFMGELPSALMYFEGNGAKGVVLPVRMNTDKQEEQSA